MEITIQRDGLIAIREHGEDIRYVDTNDPMAIFAVFRAHTIFEEGLTLRQLMKALRPWQNVLSRTAWMNFDAWLTAADKTHIADADDDDADEPVVAVEIYCILDIYRADDNVVKISTHWDFNGKFAKPVDLGTGHLTDTCGLTFSAPKTFANVPIIINNRPSIHDIAVGPPEGKRPIIAERMPGVYEHLELYPTFFDTVVLGLLDILSFHGDPADTDDRGAEIAEAIAEIKERVAVSAEDNRDETADTKDDVEEDLAMTFDEFSASLGIVRDRTRDNAVFDLDRALEEASSGDEELAPLLGLTVLGLNELKRGITAHFDTATLLKMRVMIQALEQNKRIQELSHNSDTSPPTSDDDKQ